jgi:hypothetical protein
MAPLSRAAVAALLLAALICGAGASARSARARACAAQPLRRRICAQPRRPNTLDGTTLALLHPTPPTRAKTRRSNSSLQSHAPSPPHARAAAAACDTVVTGYTATYGARDSTKLERFNNQTDQWAAKGNISVSPSRRAALLPPASSPRSLHASAARMAPVSASGWLTWSDTPPSVPTPTPHRGSMPTTTPPTLASKGSK